MMSNSRMLRSSTPDHKAATDKTAKPGGVNGGAAVGRVASSPLFSGTIFLADLAFRRKDQGDAVTALSADDTTTVLEYMTLACPTILRYARQYGEPSAIVSQQTLKGQVSVNSEKYDSAWLKNWVDTLANQYGVRPNDCICVLNPPSMINTSDALPSIGGYHSKTSRCRFIFVNLSKVGLTVADRDLAYAVSLSHEMAEMIVDPDASSNPEVCDPCAGNCGHVTLNFFLKNGAFVGSVTDALLPPNFDYFVEGIVQPAFVNKCPAPFPACAYFPEIWRPLGGDGYRDLAVQAYSGGRLALFALGKNRDAWRLDQIGDGDDWGGWESFGGHDLQNVAAAANEDGRLEVFALGADQTLYHLYQIGAEGVWGQWESLGGNGLSQFDVVRDASGCLNVVAIGSGGECNHVKQVTKNGGWGSWSSLGGHGFKMVRAGIGSGSNLFLWVVDGNNALYVAEDGAPGWNPIGAPALKDFSLLTGDDGKLNLVGVSSQANAIHISQVGVGLDFAPWEALAGHDLATVRAALNADGRLEVFAVGGDGKIYHKWKFVGGGWSEWAGLGSTQDLTFRQVCPLRNFPSTPEGATIAAFGLTSNGAPATIAQSAPNGGWI